MDIPVIEKQSDGVLLVRGELNIQTVMDFARQTTPVLTEEKRDVCLDLRGVERADSAGLALLIEWQRLAKRQGFSITFQNLPAQLMQIARVSDLHKVLPIQT